MSTLNVKSIELEQIVASPPKLTIIYVCQTTKNGKYRGSGEYEHFADNVIRVENGVARSERTDLEAGGNCLFFNSHNLTIYKLQELL